MLWDTSALDGYAIEASDGRIGSASDFLFDDARWIVRWLGRRRTGNWLSGRKVAFSCLFRLWRSLNAVAAPIPYQTDHATGQGQS